jgi:hypothetical protein
VVGRDQAEAVVVAGAADGFLPENFLGIQAASSEDAKQADQQSDGRSMHGISVSIQNKGQI